MDRMARLRDLMKLLGGVGWGMYFNIGYKRHRDLQVRVIVDVWGCVFLLFFFGCGCVSG